MPAQNTHETAYFYNAGHIDGMKEVEEIKRDGYPDEWAEHVAGMENYLADALARLSIGKGTQATIQQASYTKGYLDALKTLG